MPKPQVLHPYDTNDYDDLPEGTKIVIPVTFRDRITAVCLDPHHCTIANAISHCPQSGILDLGRRGVSRKFVAMLLDPKVHPWATAGRWYRGYLPRGSSKLTVELDLLAQSPTMQKQMSSSLKEMSAALPLGQQSVWAEIVITSPPPSAKKGYRSKSTVRGRTGSGRTKPASGIANRGWQPTAKSAAKKKVSV